MAEITSGSRLDEARDGELGARAAVISLLDRVSELEHGLVYACLFVACLLKNDAGEGGLTEEQASAVRGWRRTLLATADMHFGHLVQLSTLLSAISAAPRIGRPHFPMTVTAGTTAVSLTLEPFSPAALDHLATVDSLLDQLYAAARTALAGVREDTLFGSAPETPARSAPIDLGGTLVPVVDLASARAAFVALADRSQEESGDAVPLNGAFDAIRAEHAGLTADAQQSSTPFDPVRRAVRHPTTRRLDGTTDATNIDDRLTGAVGDLFNSSYDTMLLLLLNLVTGSADGGTDPEEVSSAIRRLMNSVIRPLAEVLSQLPAVGTSLIGGSAGLILGDGGKVTPPSGLESADAAVDQRLWQLATLATQLHAYADLPLEMMEATAALQDLACRFVSSEGSDDAASRIAALQEMQKELGPSIQSSLNGPYLVTNVDNLYTWLGERIPTRPQMALCRCGGSALKPFCDGSHARIDFTGEKDPKRVPDRRDTYNGLQVTILDNRGLCQHSGFCTDRLATVFRVNQEPFVAPSGGRMDEIIRAVRSCPSGALSYAIDGQEAREQVDWDGKREPAIEMSKDGPYRVTGGIALLNHKGEPERRNQGASVEHFALCRCGQSQNKPFCSGMHWYVNFQDPKPDPDRVPTLFEWAGGFPALARMTRIFYEKYVPEDPLLAPLFANMSPDHPERVAAWLGETFGGPKAYLERYGGYDRMLSQHLGKALTEEQRSRWVQLISRAADDAHLPDDPEFRAAFVGYLEWGSRIAKENSQPGARPPLHMPDPRWWWVCDATPGSRISALAPQPEEETAPSELPGPDETVGFTQHIKPLFRQRDRQSMLFAFDLWKLDAVQAHADAILQRLQTGSMPCDGAWPQERVDVFQRWVESGMKE